VCSYAQNENLINDTLQRSDTLKKVQIFLNRIIIDGNDVTEEEVILRELTIKENSYIDLDDLQNDVLRIYNLGLFTKVDLIPIPLGGNKINLIIDVEESFYFLPIPIAGFRDNEIKKFWGGIDFRWRNFRGMNESIGISFGLGYEPFVNLYYINPWIGKEKHFFGSFSFRYSINENQSVEDNEGSVNSHVENYDIKNLSGSISMGKYFTKSLSSSIKFAYRYSKISEYKEGRTFSEDGIDQYPALCLSLNYDTRDLIEYATYGSLYKVAYTKYGFFRNNINFNKFRLDTRRYIPIKIVDDYSITFATRFLSSIAFGGRIPSYLHEFFGYNEVIRGWKTILLEGENQMGFFNEIRIPILKPFYVKGTDLPLIKSISFLKNFNYRYGLYFTLFFDMGGVWNRNENFFKTRFRNGFGTGLNFIMPFGFIGRLDLAFRKEGKKFTPQLNVALNASF
jgi:outer membrane protein insertion porin family